MIEANINYDYLKQIIKDIFKLTLKYDIKIDKIKEKKYVLFLFLKR